MPRVVAFAGLVVLAACHSAPPPARVAPAEANEATPEVLHARGVAILTLLSGGTIPAGDIFVTWTPKPDLYTTVSRTDSTVASSLVSTDGLVGTAAATWQGGRQREVSIRWVKGSATPYQARWETIRIACRRTPGATLVTETEPDGEHFFWTITADGALVRLTRDRDPGFERRPLEMTQRVTDYVRLREVWEH